MRVASVLLTCVIWGCSSRTMSAPRLSAAETEQDETATVWRDVKTPHFIVRTNLDVPAAIDAGVTLEAERDAIVAAAWPGFPFEEGDRTEAVVHANRERFRHYFENDIGAFGINAIGVDSPPRFYTAGLPARHPWDGAWVRFALVQELLKKVYPRRARWFAAGLGGLLQTVREADNGKSILIGEANQAMLTWLRRGGLLPLREILEWKQPASDPRQGVFLATSWLFVHWLYDHRPEPFANLQRELAQGTPPKRAFEIAFPDFDADAADHELIVYLQEGAFGIRAAKKRPAANAASASFEIRVLEAKEVHVELARRAGLAASRALTKSETGTFSKEMTHEVANALRLDPSYVPALWLDSWTSIEDRRERWRKATEAHPDDPTAWFGLGHCLSHTGDTRGAEKAYRRSMELRPNNALPLNQLAWMMVKAGQAQDALPLALRAMRLAPANPMVLDTYALTLFNAGRCKEALAAQVQAVEAVSQLAGHDRDYDKRLADYEKACGAE